MKNLIFFVILILTLSYNSMAQTTYYVSLSGNNSNDGLTEETAWRTFSYAASSSSPVTGGDIVYIKAGDYGLDDIFIDKNYEPTSQRISFIGYKNTPGDIDDGMSFSYGDNLNPFEMPLINPGDRVLGEGINLSDIYSITIKNIQIGNSLVGLSIWNSSAIDSKHVLENIFFKNIGDGYSTALSITRGNGNTIKNCLIVNATGAGMDIWGNSNTIKDCKVYSDESEITEDGTYTSMDYYIVLKGDYNTVRDCYIERVGNLEDVGHGMEIKESGEHNLFVDCVGKNMIGGCFSVRWSDVKFNEFRNCKAIGGLEDISGFMIRDGASNNVFNSCISDGCDAGVRYILSGEDEDYCGEYNVFNNCIFKDAIWALDLNYWYYSGAPVDNNIFANCIIDNATNLFNCERPNSGNKLVNCIITNVDNYLVGDDPSNFEYINCDFFNNGFTISSGTGNIESDPLFVDAGNGDYHLSTGSPCIDAGTEDNAPDTDFEGVDRLQGNGYDIGAYECSGTTDLAELYDRKGMIYPNPISDFAFVSNSFENMNYQIVAIDGMVVNKGKISNRMIDFSGLINGVYFVKIIGSQEILSYKVLVNK